MSAGFSTAPACITGTRPKEGCYRDPEARAEPSCFPTALASARLVLWTAVYLSQAGGRAPGGPGPRPGRSHVAQTPGASSRTKQMPSELPLLPLWWLWFAWQWPTLCAPVDCRTPGREPLLFLCSARGTSLSPLWVRKRVFKHLYIVGSAGSSVPCGFSLIVVSRAPLSLRCADSAPQQPLGLWSTGPGQVGPGRCGVWPSRWGTRVQRPCGLWDLPGPGMELVPFALQDGFLNQWTIRK